MLNNFLLKSVLAWSSRIGRIETKFRKSQPFKVWAQKGLKLIAVIFETPHNLAALLSWALLLEKN